MLFMRDFAGFTGGHFKFAHYLRHTAMSGLVRPVLYQTARSRTVPGNIFNDYEGATTDELRPFPAYFIAGLDWLRLDEAGIHPGPAPVLNLIQDFRFADPQSPVFALLSRPAVRICVSPQLAEAIRGAANGEVYAVANGIEIDPVPPLRSLTEPPRILIAGLKKPDLGRELAMRLESHVDVDLITDLVPRATFLARMAAATICVLLPSPFEGFFLPPLEAMLLGRGVVTPDCGYTLAYCRPGENCLMPAYTVEALASATHTLIEHRALLESLASEGRRTAADHTIARERAAYHAILAACLAGH